jgi:ABC-2 type transport system permease protein
MARLLVQLKLRLLTNALRSSTAAQTTFILSTFFALVVAVGGFYVLTLFRGNSASVDLTTVIFSAFALGWLVLPIMASGLDGTLDPATLALYPLRTRPLAVGLLAASATGAWPAANLIAMLGVMVGLARGGLGLLVAVVAVVLQLLFCITLARLVTTSMAGMLRSRRGKDLAVFLVIPAFALIELLGQVIPNVAAHGGITAASFAGVDAWMRWLPPGLAAHAIQDASDGRPGTALARLAVLTAVIVVLGWLWIRSLGRALVTADTSTGSAQLRGGALPLARYGLRGAVAARFWIYQRREPTSLVYWAMTAVIMAVVSASTILGTAGPHKHPGVVIASAVVGAGFVGYFHANSIGLTGPPFLVEALALTSRRSLRAYFSGQNIALAVIAVPLLSAMCFGLAAAVRHPTEGVPATAVALAGLGAALGLSNILSVTLAYPMARRTGSPMRQAAQGYGSYTFGGILGSVAGTAVAATPVILAAAFTSTAPAAVRTPAIIIGSAAYGLGLAWAGVQIAAREADGRLPELSQIAVRSTI